MTRNDALAYARADLEYVEHVLAELFAMRAICGQGLVAIGSEKLERIIAAVERGVDAIEAGITRG